MAVEVSFTAQIDAWVKKTKQRMEVVFKNASESVIEEIISRTPVDTGFLRASLTASLDSMVPMSRGIPPGTPPGKNQGGVVSFEAPVDHALVIQSAQLGQTIYASFTANYARHVEYGTKNQFPAAMVRLSAQNWSYHVEQAIRQAKAAVASRSK